MYWNGVGSTTNIGLPDVSLTLVQSGDDRFDIYMDNNDVVSGFQFTIDDVPDYYEFNSISATDRIPADWSLSGNENGGDAILLGFSFNGTTIEPGSGMIASVYMEPLNEEFTSELCFSDYVLSNPQAEQYFAFAGCVDAINPFEEPTPPIELTASSSESDDSIMLEWTTYDDSRERAVVDLQITGYENGQIAVSMTNEEAVGGIQFDIDATNGISDLVVTGASGGSSADAGFTVSTNSSGLVLGFSFSGASIPAGSGVLCYVDGTFSGALTLMMVVVHILLLLILYGEMEKYYYLD